MEIFELIFIAVGLAADAFAVSVSNGISMKLPKRRQIFYIAAAYGIFQGIMPLTGYTLGTGFAKYMEAYAHWIALVLLAGIGIKMITEGIRPTIEGESGGKEKGFSWGLLLTQAFATSIDALMIGIVFAAGSTPILFSVSIISAITFVISLAGVCIGRRFGNIFGSKSEVLGGIILIAIGLKTFLENTIFI